MVKRPADNMVPDLDDPYGGLDPELCKFYDEREKKRRDKRGGDDAKPRPALIAAPYRWRDPATIPRRQFLFGRHYIRGTIGATIGAGGRAKTTKGLLEFVGMACGRNLLTGEHLTP